MTYETSTSLAPDEVLARARRFFHDRVPNTSAFPEEAGPGFLTLRGQGGEEIALSVSAVPGGSRVRASTLFFDQAVGRFISTLPEPREGAA
jgi:hypothetical protein